MKHSKLILGLLGILSGSCSDFSRTHDDFCALRPDACGDGGVFYNGSPGGSVTGGGGSGGGGGVGGFESCPALDSSQVFVFGGIIDATTGESIGGAITSFSSGAPCVALQAEEVVLRPTDNALIYLDLDLLHVFAFNPDSLTYDKSLGWTYPSNPEGNDAPIDTSSCKSFSHHVFMRPDEGKVVYDCNGPYFVSDGTPFPVPQGAILLHMGYNGLALGKNSNTWLSVFQNGQGQVLTGIPGTSEFPEYITARATNPAGFHMALNTFQQGASIDQLWSVDSTGNALQLGTFADPPNGVEFLQASNAALDPSDNLYEIGQIPDPQNSSDPTYVVVKRPLTPGTSSIVYSVNSIGNNLLLNPISVKVNISTRTSALITGP